MNLLHGIPPEVYTAYFRRTEGPGRPLETSFGATVCAEDPNWEDKKVRRLSEMAVHTLARNVLLSLTRFCKIHEIHGYLQVLYPQAEYQPVPKRQGSSALPRPTQHQGTDQVHRRED